MAAHAKWEDVKEEREEVTVDDLTVEPYPWYRYPFPIPKWAFFLVSIAGILGALYLSIKFAFEWSNSIFPNATRVCP
jgi:hypothetical protein